MVLHEVNFLLYIDIFLLFGSMVGLLLLCLWWGVVYIVSDMESLPTSNIEEFQVH